MKAGKADYPRKLLALASAGGEVLVVRRLYRSGRQGYHFRQAFDSGAFDTFVSSPTAWVGQQLVMISADA